MIGRTLAHYEITSQIGKGGMGEVYQAKDTKLGRDVAIKVLPEEFAKDADRVARFQREAKLLASLNHPNIAAIYGLEESDGTNFLVMELVEGQTLDDRVKSGAIPVEETLKLALQIAEALEAAHEKGVIHRDLKPANIKVTPDGKVKVLDFGLAKAFAGEQADLNLSNSPTLSVAATQQGVILGTAAYMPPEQARGKEVDKRADIWAFGVVLFEMLTGRQVFSENTVSDTLASVLKTEPKWDSLPPNLHPRIRLMLERCLEKNPQRRYSGINDAWVDIDKVLADPGGLFAQPGKAMEPRKKLRTMIPWIVVLILAGIIAGLSLKQLSKPEPQIISFDYSLPEGQQFTEDQPVLAVSADGKKFAYATPEGLYLRSLDELTAGIISGTEGNTANPFFSPDGKWVGYYSAGDRKLKKISVNGGAPIPLCDVSQLLGARWYEDDTIVYGQPGGIMRVSSEGGIPESLIKSEGYFIGFPQMLPDGKTILYTANYGGTDLRIMMQSLISRDSKELFPGTYAHYVPSGFIVYALPNENNLFAVPFNLDRLEKTGGEVHILKGVLQRGGGLAHYAISDSGTLIYLPGSAADPNNQRTLVWIDRNGKVEPIDLSPKFYKYPNISPDGTRVAVTDYTGSIHHIFIKDLVGKGLKQLTFEGTDNLCPVWSPDSGRIVFWGGGLYCKAADGSGQAEKLSGNLIPYCWSRDGKTIIGVEMSSTLDDENIGMLSMEGDHNQKTLLRQPSVERSPKLAPDDRWMAYTFNDSGREEVYVKPFPDVDAGKWRISEGGGAAPLWSRDGRELFYLNDDRVMVVSVTTDPSFDFGKPQILFQGMFIGPASGEGTPWDIHPSSKKFLMIKPGESAGLPHKIIVITNWFEKIKERVSVP